MPSYKDVPWLESAQSLMGTHEGGNPKILAWAKVIGGAVSKEYTSDTIPWCGLFVGYCMVDNGIEPPATPLWALSWADWGNKLDEPAWGTVMSFSRSGGGHVGFYVGEDDDYFFILGGNQGDEVNVTRVSKSRLAGTTWPTGQESLLVTGRVTTDYAAAKASVNG